MLGVRTVAPTLLSVCLACSSVDRGQDAHLRLTDAQFVSGALPAETDSPTVAAVELLNHTFWPGQSNKPLRGSLGPTATAAAIALSGDIGYWVVVAGAPDVATPSLPTFKTTAAFSRDLGPGEYYLEVHAVDSRGNLGPKTTALLTGLDEQPRATPMGELVVSLDWESVADLDLHVADPLGNEIYHAAPTSHDAFASKPSSASIGVLNADANPSCLGSGSASEHVVWKAEPPSGTYLVRVDAVSMCGMGSSAWTISVKLLDQLLAQRRGIFVDADTAHQHDRGAGLLVMSFEVP